MRVSTCAPWRMCVLHARARVQNSQSLSDTGNEKLFARIVILRERRNETPIITDRCDPSRPVSDGTIHHREIFQRAR